MYKLSDFCTIGNEMLIFNCQKVASRGIRRSLFMLYLNILTIRKKYFIIKISIIEYISGELLSVLSFFSLVCFIFVHF